MSDMDEGIGGFVSGDEAEYEVREGAAARPPSQMSDVTYTSVADALGAGETLVSADLCGAPSVRERISLPPPPPSSSSSSSSSSSTSPFASSASPSSSSSFSAAAAASRIFTDASLSVHVPSSSLSSSASAKTSLLNQSVSTARTSMDSDNYSNITTNATATTTIQKPVNNNNNNNIKNNDRITTKQHRPGKVTQQRPRANTVSSPTISAYRKAEALADAPVSRPRANTFSSGGNPTATSEPVSKINLRSRINRHPVQEKIRHKRQTLQDMARPLKHWLYKNRDNPYPTKPEKISLARGSEMTLVQVSNWFANARRRLKNTVKDSDISWSRRIKKYNSNVKGNAELLSISSDDSMWDSSDDDENKGNEGNNTLESFDACMRTSSEENLHSESRSSNTLISADSSNNIDKCDAQSEDMGGPLFFTSNEDEFVATNTTRSRNSSGYCSEDQSQPQKYKQTMLHRYLHDAYEQVCTHANVENDTSMRMRYRCPSGSVSSHDFEDIASSRSTPTNEHFMLEDCQEVEEFLKQRQNASNSSEEESLYYKELSAAMALTTLARNKYSKANVTSHK